VDCLPADLNSKGIKPWFRAGLVPLTGGGVWAVPDPTLALRYGSTAWWRNCPVVASLKVASSWAEAGTPSSFRRSLVGVTPVVSRETLHLTLDRLQGVGDIFNLRLNLRSPSLELTLLRHDALHRRLHTRH
jgi:hypothetical protein